jgi:hypothetical protein
LQGDDQLVFVHIPKTGGTALGTYLERQFRPEAVYQVINMSTEELDPAVLARYAFVRGHFFYGLISRLITRSAAYVTFLRDPVECVLSHYAHIQRYEPFPRYAIGHGLDLEEFVFNPLAVQRITNLQTRMLGTRLHFARLEQVYVAGKGPSAEQAIEVLEGMACFGITEQFAQSLALLAYTFDWPGEDAVPMENVAPERIAREDLAPHVLERILELNQEDSKLYEYGRRLFNARFSALLDGLLADDYRRSRGELAASHGEGWPR